MTIVLHNYWRSTSSYRVRIALCVKQLAFEYRAINIVKRDQFSAEYRAKNSMQQVPTLEIDGIALTQSLPIIEFLDEKYPEIPLLPKDPIARVRTRILAEIVNSGIQPLQNLTVTGQVKALGGDTQAWARGFIETGLAAFDTELAQTAGQFCVGDHVTLADCCLVPQLYAARRFGTDTSKLARLAEIEARLLALPAFINAHPDQQPDAVK